MPFDCKLGLQRSPSSTVPLHQVHAEGGLLPQTVLLVQRKHPTLMWQRLPDGRVLLQSLTAHAAAQEAAAAQQAQVFACACGCSSICPAEHAGRRLLGPKMLLAEVACQCLCNAMRAAPSARLS